ncbi:DsbA family protein [Patescibacteria group bacterium]|nr:DsbA family protein [Patescibacteria group bacterium]MBU4099477.1 DsbA family protein [Patescibacteria group bacterium]
MKKDLIPTPEKKIEKPKKEYIEIQIPRISFKDTGINAYLVTALIIFAFFLGMLTNKVLSLEKTLKTQNSNTDQTNNILGDTNNAPQAPTQTPKADVSIGHLPTLGAKDAKVTIIYFSDPQCPFSERFENNTYPQIFDTYIKANKIKFAYRHYPLTSIHPNSQKASEAGECANEQNKFWEYQKLIFKNQSTWSPQSSVDAVNSFTDYADELNLNTDQFRSCLDTDKYEENVQKDITGGNQAGVDGTPTFFINGQRLVGAQPFDQISALIEQELKK